MEKQKPHGQPVDETAKGEEMQGTKINA